MIMFKPVTRIAAACALIFSQSSQAATLQEVLRQSFGNDPELLEAQATRDAARTDVKIAKSGHLPTVTLTAAQVLAQKHRYESNARSRLDPGIQGRLNLYSFGGVDARVRYSEHKYDYYHHKYYETQETVGQTIGQLYLSALRAKENIIAAQSNLQRHDQIINDLQIIAKYDKGRQSELDQAVARRLRVHAYLADQTRSMELSLSRLGKYTQKRLNPAALTDPFAGESATSIVKRYQNPDLGQQPSYLAQQSERESVLAELDINKSARYPAIDLIASASRDNKEIYVNFNWDFYSPSANYQVEKSSQTLVAAEAKSDQILRDVAERSRSSEVDMRQSLNRYNIAQQQIAAQKKVIKAYELQFKIARRTLIDVLDSYSDLWNIESEVVAAQNDFRDAALEYLSSQAAIAQFAGVAEDRRSPERTARRKFRDHLPEEFLPKSLQERFDKIDFDKIDQGTAYLGDQLNYLKDKAKEKLDKVLPEDTPSQTDAATENVSSASADYPVIVDADTLNGDSNQPYVPAGKAAAKAKVAAAKKSDKKSDKTKTSNKPPVSFEQLNTKTAAEPVNETADNMAADYPVITDANTLNGDSNQPYIPTGKAAAKAKVAAAKKSAKTKTSDTQPVSFEQLNAKTGYATMPEAEQNQTVAAPQTDSEAFRQPETVVAPPQTSHTVSETKSDPIHENQADSRPAMSPAQAMPVHILSYDDVIAVPSVAIDNAVVKKQQQFNNGDNEIASRAAKPAVSTSKKISNNKQEVKENTRATPTPAKKSAKKGTAKKNTKIIQSSVSKSQPTVPPKHTTKKVKLVESPELGVMLNNESPKSDQPNDSKKLKNSTSSNELPQGLTFETRVAYEMTT